jgi:glycosyltransferase involved in cell wall biosynthesis
MLKILHLAPENYAGVPYSYFEMHNALGDLSRLVTYHKNKLQFPVDICLNIPLPDFPLASRWRNKKGVLVRNSTVDSAPEFRPRNFIEAIYFKFDYISRKNIVEKAIKEYQLDGFDIIHYDGGLDLYRDASQAKKWKKEGKKIVCCYYGSDLRSRGIIKELDDISDLNLTSEFDHLALKKDLHYLFYPYDPSELPVKEQNTSGRIRIIHAPTNRQYKGTDLIIRVIEKLKKDRNLEFILLENVPRWKVLEQKKHADICIDQVGGTGGGTGYGKAGLESLAMGIPTITNMSSEYAKWLPENPFIVANSDKELTEALIMLLESPDLRKTKAADGKEWVLKHHGYDAVNKKLKELYGLKKII